MTPLPAPDWPQARPPEAQPLRQTRTLQAEVAGTLLTIHAAYPGHDALHIEQPGGLRVILPMPPGALAELHRLLGEALALTPQDAPR
jgi:hypothetical protein